eukprot:1416450-Amphidinium_carterae.1
MAELAEKSIERTTFTKLAELDQEEDYFDYYIKADNDEWRLHANKRTNEIRQLSSKETANGHYL